MKPLHILSALFLSAVGSLPAVASTNNGKLEAICPGDYELFAITDAQARSVRYAIRTPEGQGLPVTVVNDIEDVTLLEAVSRHGFVRIDMSSQIGAGMKRVKAYSLKFESLGEWSDSVNCQL